MLRVLRELSSCISTAIMYVVRSRAAIVVRWVDVKRKSG